MAITFPTYVTKPLNFLYGRTDSTNFETSGDKLNYYAKAFLRYKAREMTVSFGITLLTMAAIKCGIPHALHLRRFVMPAFAFAESRVAYLATVWTLIAESCHNEKTQELNDLKGRVTALEKLAPANSQS